MALLHIVTAGAGLDPATEAEISRLVASGGIVAYPTETYYGLGASPWDERAVARLLALKRERGDKPIPLVLASPGALLRVAAVLPPALDALARRFWPGPLTVVLRARSDLAPGVCAGSATVAARVPGHPLARELARLAGGALTSTSANPAGEKPPRRAAEVEAYFGDHLQALVDGGETPGGPPSTILDLAAVSPRLLREGAVATADLRAALVALGLSLA